MRTFLHIKKTFSFYYKTFYYIIKVHKRDIINLIGGKIYESLEGF